MGNQIEMALSTQVFADEEELERLPAHMAEERRILRQCRGRGVSATRKELKRQLREEALLLKGYGHVSPEILRWRTRDLPTFGLWALDDPRTLFRECPAPGYFGIEVSHGVNRTRAFDNGTKSGVLSNLFRKYYGDMREVVPKEHLVPGPGGAAWSCTDTLSPMPRRWGWWALRGFPTVFMLAEVEFWRTSYGNDMPGYPDSSQGEVAEGLRLLIGVAARKLWVLDQWWAMSVV